MQQVGFTDGFLASGEITMRSERILPAHTPETAFADFHSSRLNVQALNARQRVELDAAAK